MADGQQLITDGVVSTAERIENGDTLDPLEVKVEASIDGQLSEIIMVLTTGGPHIEVALYAGRVDGYWGGDEHSVPIMDDEADERLDGQAERYREYWETNVLQ